MSDSDDRRHEPASGWRGASTRRAFSIHLAISAAVVGTVCGLIFAVWYPPPYFSIEGTWSVLRVLIGVDLILGPLLTLILFRPGKPGLAMDMTMILTIQLTALIYGTSVIYQQRPYFMVFAVDRFEILARADVSPTAADALPFASKPLRGPALVFAERPTDPEAFQRLLVETVFEHKPDLERRPRYWRPYDAHRADVLERAGRLDALAAQRPDAAGAVARAGDALGRDPSQLAYLPVIGTDRVHTLVIDPESAEPLTAIDVDPWAR